MTNEERSQIIEIWKTIVGVQTHFNDVSMRIRGLFVTILLAIFAALGFLLNKELKLHVWEYEVQFATLVPVYGIFITYLFYFIDRYWYHQLLVGSVKHAIGIECKYREALPELSLGRTIGTESPYRPNCVIRCVAKTILVRHEKFVGNGMLHSVGKIEFFYKSVIAVLLGTALLVGVFGGVTSDVAASSQSAPPPPSNSANYSTCLFP